eukprot:TRINITY_DN4539_c0_g1_i1.p2 TRINITY_DN4539_c0_g1~~TRINITY_DN4539_c0_g1_i1.p2  ORF type:complete len:611 (-),score=118.14 TRINITY_DN4539_c0_g1_i1:104-1936(-)
MNFVAGFILLNAGQSKDASKDCFFCLVQMMVKYRANLLFCDGLPLLKLHTFQFRLALAQLFPEIHRHFADAQITPELYLTKWILTIFTQPLPFESAARVWDLILCDGLQAIVLVALAIIKLMKARLLREDTEGILELMSGRADTAPLSGGDIVRTALQLEAQLPPGSLSDGTGIRPSRYFQEWELCCPEEVADFHRAEAEIFAGRVDTALQTEDVPSGAAGGSEIGAPLLEAPLDGMDVQAEVAEPSTGSELSLRNHVSASMEENLAADPALRNARSARESSPPIPMERDGDNDGVEGSPKSASPHVIGAEARVVVNPPMPRRKPSAARAKRGGGGGPSSDSERDSPPVRSRGAARDAKRSASLGCLASGGLLLTDEEIGSTTKHVRGGNSSKKSADAISGDVRREEAGHHRRGQGSGGRQEAGCRPIGLKAAGSPPAPAPDVRRNGGRSGSGAPARSIGSSSPNSGCGVRAREKERMQDFEVADEHGALEGKAVGDSKRKSRSSSSHSGGRYAPAMSSREVEQDVFIHGQTWPLREAREAASERASAVTAPAAPRLPHAQARSRSEHFGQDEKSGALSVFGQIERLPPPPRDQETPENMPVAPVRQATE